ncbi:MULTISPECIES: outer membrane protein assembly factor BamD [unclassified Halomonas]|uniref:outer membrane protein assembly factor BamD n=1 Tax=unclassified Halomonas TaxID=2609666 RepID=UPI0006DAB018|nr:MULTISPECIES: outer membrane protein assembly factor BamD [unclassified Halomonas]KPQ21934.1 MAG: outer membrane protein assembly factor BamD [Halomonas sp. HL-93]SBR46239.1 Beta-barrel assembly machine subunit BamD [Halomonas sp. HL-93]SNY98647.1 Beta-barrel assembly machine subunit BamD [Halomonas sp. hl-4]
MRVFSAANRFGVLALSFALLAGCASNDTTSEEEDEYAGVDERELYDRARDALDDNRFNIAIERLEALDTRYPFGEHAEQAQLEIIYAYYENSDWEEARAAASRFIRLHPDHPQVDYAYYLRGLSAWQAGRFSLERLRLIDISKRDLGATRDAYSDFRELIQRYPESEYAPDAQQRIVYLRELLARHELHVADYYLRRGAYLAAVERGRWVVENYPESNASHDALATMVEGYQGLEMDDRAEEVLAVLRENAPDHDQLDGNRFAPKHLD